MSIRVNVQMSKIMCMPIKLGVQYVRDVRQLSNPAYTFNCHILKNTDASKRWFKYTEMNDRSIQYVLRQNLSWFLS